MKQSLFFLVILLSTGQSWAQGQSEISVTPSPEASNVTNQKNIKANPLGIGGLGWVAEFELQLAKKWTASVYHAGNAKHESSDTILADTFSSSTIDRYTRSQTGLKGTGYLQGFDRDSLYLSGGIFRFRGELNRSISETGQPNRIYHSQWSGIGYVATAGMRWLWKNGLNLQVGLGANFGADLTEYPDTQSLDGKKLKGGPVEGLSLVIADFNLGYVF